MVTAVGSPWCGAHPGRPHRCVAFNPPHVHPEHPDEAKQHGRAAIHSWTGHDVVCLKVLAFLCAFLQDNLTSKAKAKTVMWKDVVQGDFHDRLGTVALKVTFVLFGHDRHVSRTGLRAAASGPGDVRSGLGRNRSGIGLGAAWSGICPGNDRIGLRVADQFQSGC